MSAQVSSAGAEARLSVPHTVMPRARAASRSIEALARPVVTMSRRAGSRSITSPGNGVRSRISTTTSYGANRATRRSGSGSWSSNTSTSAMPVTALQSAELRATRW